MDLAWLPHWPIANFAITWLYIGPAESLEVSEFIALAEISFFLKFLLGDERIQLIHSNTV